MNATKCPHMLPKFPQQIAASFQKVDRRFKSKPKCIQFLFLPFLTFEASATPASEQTICHWAPAMAKNSINTTKEELHIVDNHNTTNSTKTMLTIQTMRH